MKYFKKNLLGSILIEIVSCFAIGCEQMIPLLSAMLINYIILDNTVTEESGGIFHFLLSGKYGEPRTFELFFNIAVFFMSFLLLRIVLIYIRNLYQQHIGLQLETDLRIATYHKLNQLDSETIAKFNSGELLQTINSDTIMFKELFSRIMPFNVDSIFILVSTVVLLGMENMRFIIIPVILSPFLAVFLVKFRKQSIINYRNIRQCQSNMNLTVTENVGAVRLVRSFTNEELEKEKFDKANQAQRDNHIKQINLSANYDVPFNMIKQIAYIGTIAIGAVLVMQGKMEVGFISASAAYVMKIMNQVNNVSKRFVVMQQQLIAGQKMKHFMETETQIADNADSKLKANKPSIEIKNVSMTLDGQKVLDDVSLSIPYGKKVGIVGETGSGKSMLLKTLVRIHDIQEGSISINNHDIKDYSLMNLRNMFSYVFQDVFLFSNSIDANIAYSNPKAPKGEIIHAAENAQAANFINRLTEQYDTIVGERGLGLSGGQKQRVSIARAFLKNAPVLVLDDSTSALDVKTERALLSEIRKDYGNKTVIIAAHRLSSVVDCDEIIYMHDGKITERGNFEELMKLNGSFANVYNLQETEKKNAINFDSIPKTEGDSASRSDPGSNSNVQMSGKGEN